MMLGQYLNDVTWQLLTSMRNVFSVGCKPDVVPVHGDIITSFGLRYDCLRLISGPR